MPQWICLFIYLFIIIIIIIIFFFFFFFFCNSTYSLYPEHWIIQQPVYVLHLFTCHGRIMPRLSELLLSLSCFVEMSVLNANSVYPDQMPRSVASDLGLHSLRKFFIISSILGGVLCPLHVRIFVSGWQLFLDDNLTTVLFMFINRLNWWGSLSTRIEPPTFSKYSRVNRHF